MQRKRQVLLQAKTRQGIPYDRVFLRDLTTDINEQIRKDWRNWLDDILDRLAKADENKDYRTIQYLLGLLHGLNSKVLVFFRWSMVLVSSFFWSVGVTTPLVTTLVF